MENAYLIILMLLGLLIFWQVYNFIRSKMSVGTSIPFSKLDREFTEKIKDKSGLLYFYSNTCHNCKTQDRIIEKIKQNYDSIISVDVAKLTEVAKIFNVMGTPSLIFFGGNKIQGYYVGVKNESFITDKLKIL